MIYCLLVITFFAVVATGPAGVGWLEGRRTARRALEDRPLARVVYLPSAACRSNVLAGRCMSETCAVCVARVTDREDRLSEPDDLPDREHVDAVVREQLPAAADL